MNYQCTQPFLYLLYGRVSCKTFIVIFQSYPMVMAMYLSIISRVTFEDYRLFLTYISDYSQQNNKQVNYNCGYMKNMKINYTRISLNFPVLSAHMKNSVTMCVVLKQLDPCIWMVTSCLLVLCATLILVPGWFWVII